MCFLVKEEAPLGEEEEGGAPSTHDGDALAKAMATSAEAEAKVAALLTEREVASSKNKEVREAAQKAIAAAIAAADAVYEEAEGKVEDTFGERIKAARAEALAAQAAMVRIRRAA